MKKMKKILIIFGVLSLLIFIRPALGLNSVQTTTESTTIVQTEEATSDRFIDEALGGIKQFYFYTGFANATAGNLIMILIGTIFIYLGIKFDYEPLLLIPIGAGVIIGNIPFVAGNQTGILRNRISIKLPVFWGGKRNLSAVDLFRNWRYDRFFRRSLPIRN